jgi:hypothetical protein
MQNKRCCCSYRFRQIATPYFVPKATTIAVLFSPLYILQLLLVGLVAGLGGGGGGGGGMPCPVIVLKKLDSPYSYRPKYIKFGGNISDRGLNYFLDEIKPSCG